MESKEGESRLTLCQASALSKHYAVHRLVEQWPRALCRQFFVRLIVLREGPYREMNKCLGVLFLGFIK